MNEPTEGNQTTNGGAPANAQPSSAGGQPFEGVAELKATLDKALAKLEAQDGEIRALKSGKDKAVDRLTKDVGPMKETLEKLAKYLGVDEEKIKVAQREMIIDELYAEKFGGRQPEQPANGMAASQGKAADASLIVKELGLDENDPEVAAVLREGADPLKLAKVAINMAKKPTPSPSGAPALGSAPAPTMTDERIEQLAAQRNALYKEPSKNRDKIKAIEKQLVEAGVKLD